MQHPAVLTAETLRLIMPHNGITNTQQIHVVTLWRFHVAKKIKINQRSANGNGYNKAKNKPHFHMQIVLFMSLGEDHYLFLHTYGRCTEIRCLLLSNCLVLVGSKSVFFKSSNILL